MKRMKKRMPIFAVRMRPEHRQMWVDGAKMAGETLSGFLRNALRRSYRRVLRDEKSQLQV
jgi:uncharacterized protein (DUF1778 family)